MNEDILFKVLMTIGVIAIIAFFVYISMRQWCSHKWRVLNAKNVTYSTKLFGINQGKVSGEVVVEECEACKEKRAYVTDGCERYGMDVGYVERKFFS